MMFLQCCHIVRKHATFCMFCKSQVILRQKDTAEGRVSLLQSLFATQRARGSTLKESTACGYGDWYSHALCHGNWYIRPPFKKAHNLSGLTIAVQGSSFLPHCCLALSLSLQHSITGEGVLQVRYVTLI